MILAQSNDSSLLLTPFLPMVLQIVVCVTSTNILSCFLKTLMTQTFQCDFSFGHPSSLGHHHTISLLILSALSTPYNIVVHLETLNCWCTVSFSFITLLSVLHNMFFTGPSSLCDVRSRNSAANSLARLLTYSSL
jgi:hypothetical protein